MSDASTYTAAKYGLEAGYEQGYATALRDAFDEIQDMRGLRLDGPQMQTEAERRIRMLGGER